MSYPSTYRRRHPDWPLAPVSLAVLLACLWYTLTLVFYAPYPGITLNNGWVVMQIDSGEEHPQWWAASADMLRVGDQLLAIGDLTLDEYRRDRRYVPFAGYSPGERVLLTVRRDGTEQAVLWQMPASTMEHRAFSLLGVLAYLPFWLAGTLVLLFLRPRDARWQLLVSFNYMAAFWLATGQASSTHINSSSLVAHALSWLLIPICLRLHLLVPTPLIKKDSGNLALWSYVVASLLALMEFGQLLPTYCGYAALFLAILASLGLLVYRLSGHSSPPVHRAASLMLASIGIAFVPGLLIVFIPSLIDPGSPGMLQITAAMLAVPIMPLSYTYAIYKHNLGTLEFRANRLLSAYSFVLLCAAAYALVFVLGAYQINLSGSAFSFSLLVSVIFSVTASAGYPFFQRLIDQLVYGTAYNPDVVIRAFANQIPAALSLEALAGLLAGRVAPSLLVRQSALYQLNGGSARLIYASGIQQGDEHSTDTIPDGQLLARLLHEAGHYRPARACADPEDPLAPAEVAFDWVRLAIPLRMRQETVGIWLFGRRDPDDFYPREDIDLLTTLADQVTVALENIRLYEQAQREISERKEAQAALRESEGRYRNLFNRVPTGLYRTTPSGQILDANPALVQMLGYPDRESLLASSAVELFLNPGARQEELAELEHKDVIRGFEMQLYRYDGSIIWVRDTSRAVHDSSGQLLYFEGSLEDVTEQKRLEEQFRQAQKMEAIGRLAGGVAHDFNNLLTTIAGYTSLLLSEINSDKPLEASLRQSIRADLEEIEHTADRATALTKQLLAFSRRQVMQPRPLDLNELVQETEKMLRRVIGEDIELRTRLAPALGCVRADPTQIEQVILNLAVNARDAMPQGGQLILETANLHLSERDARERPEVHPGPYVLLAVRDTGAGMDFETQSHLFEPFFTTKEQGKGTGLGLATVFGIVKQSGGDIRVYSAPGKGTTFEIYLPQTNRCSPANGGQQHALENSPGSETILLVEDEDSVRLLAQRVLERHGYTVLDACDAHGALDLARLYNRPIHLLVTDIIMPGGVSGWELAERLSAMRHDVRILYMSGYASEQMVQAVAANPKKSFIPKPFTPDALAHKVREALDRG